MTLTRMWVGALIKEKNGRIWGLLLFGETVKPTTSANELDVGYDRHSVTVSVVSQSKQVKDGTSKCNGKDWKSSS